jgi:hypothetical protein
MKMDNKLSIVQCAVATAATLALLFAACWAGAYFAAIPATHLFIALFTSAAPMSSYALATGLCSALLFGALAGAVFAISFNAAGRWVRR